MIELSRCDCSEFFIEKSFDRFACILSVLMKNDKK